MDDLEKEELKRFHQYLQNGPRGNFTTVKKSLEKSRIRRTAGLMVEIHGEHVMEVAELIFKKTKEGQSEEKDMKHSVQYTTLS